MKNSKTILLFAILYILSLSNINSQTAYQKPIRLAVAGVSHGHSAFILGRKDKTDFNIVGIYESDNELALRLAHQYNFDPKLIYNDLDKMLDLVKPDAVAAFGSIFDHMAVVEACAPRGINIMVEKPLATNVESVKRMEELAQKFHVYLQRNLSNS
jgi:predicted dehydrogenase